MSVHSSSPTPTAEHGALPEADRARATRSLGRGDLLALLGLVVVALALYLPYAAESGWFHDDWEVYSQLKDAGTVGDGLTACMDQIPGGRKLACVYHVAEWSVLGDHRSAYHLVSIAFLIAAAVLAYAIARRCRLAPGWSFLLAVATIVFPGSDSTRLWAVASIGQYVVVLQLTGLLLALIALGRPPGSRAIALHVTAAALALIAMTTYEIAVPLVALQGLVYVAAYGSRRALARWAVDVGLVLAFLVYRFAIEPVPESSALVVERTTGQLVDRAGLLLEAVWDTWRFLYAPGAALLCGLVLVLVAAFATARSPELRSSLVRWWALLGAAAVAAAACALVYITANDFYVPAQDGTFNRLNLGGTIPYAAAFVALMGLLFDTVRWAVPWRLAAPLAVVVVALGVANHQVGIGATHQDAWLESWSAQERTLPGMKRGLRGVPRSARVFGFDTPQWERGWIPVLAQPWDLRGMVDYVSDVDPTFASPFRDDVTCAAKGVEQGGVLVAPYRDMAQPVYFVSPRRGLAVRVSSARECDRRVAAWGRAPMWGRSITG
jgi:hypothetical protein